MSVNQDEAGDQASVAKTGPDGSCRLAATELHEPTAFPNWISAGEYEQRLTKRIEANRALGTADQRLALVWKAWHACPPGMDRYSRRLAIQDATENSESRHDQVSTVAEDLKSRGLGLPIIKDIREFSPELDLAQAWCERIHHLETSHRLHRESLRWQLDFNGADAQAAARIGILRAEAEFAASGISLLEKKEPSVEEIHRLIERHNAYTQARRAALKILQKLILRRPTKTAKPTAPGQRNWRLKEGPNELPKHIVFARLRAFELCGPDVDDYLGTVLPVLSADEKREFETWSQLPAKAHKSRYCPTYVWLADNQPIFTEFKWSWPDVSDAAERHCLPVPKELGSTSSKRTTKRPRGENTSDSHPMAKLASKNGVKLKLSLGTKSGLKSAVEKVKNSYQLLSPRPVFSGRFPDNGRQ